MSRLSDRMRRRLAANLLRAPRQTEERYVAALRSIARQAAKETVAFLLRRTDAASAEGLEEHITRIVGGLIVQVGRAFDRLAGALAKANDRAMKVQGIRASSLGIDSILAKKRAENIDLVVNAQRVYAASVKEVFENPDNEGLSVDALKEKLLERGSISESRAELIARDQTLKLNGEITKTRQENEGVTSYIWTTSNDERVREEHASLDGQTFDWSSPPGVGHPGQDIQCRCVAVPVIPL